MVLFWNAILLGSYLRTLTSRRSPARLGDDHGGKDDRPVGVTGGRWRGVKAAQCKLLGRQEQHVGVGCRQETVRLARRGRRGDADTIGKEAAAAESRGAHRLSCALKVVDGDLLPLQTSRAERSSGSWSSSSRATVGGKSGVEFVLDCDLKKQELASTCLCVLPESSVVELQRQ
nr:unnamed protein product [Digitaria exilis]